MSTALRIDPKGAQFGDDYAANRVDLPGAELPWLAERRAAAIDAFLRAGVPHRRVEAWKYTDLSTLLEPKLEPATPFRRPIAETGRLADPYRGVPGRRLLLVNGYLHGEATSDEEMDFVDLAALGDEVPDWLQAYFGALSAGSDQPLGAASLALMRGGVAVRVKAAAVAPLHLAFINPSRGRAQVQHARVLLLLEENASLTLLESHMGEAQSVEQLFANLGTEIVLKPGAQLEHVRYVSESSATLQVASLGAVIERNAGYRALYCAVGGRVSRLDCHLHLAAPGAEAVLHGVTALSGDGHADVTTVMDHASPHTKSRQLFKSVLGGNTRSVMQGRVSVREGAVKSDSHQLFKAVLLGERAEADAKPELEILADDVLCGHGTAIGALDEEALFYLRARGIAKGEARRLLVHAFLEDAMLAFTDAHLHEALWRGLDPVLAALDRTGS